MKYQDDLSNRIALLQQSSWQGRIRNISKYHSRIWFQNWGNQSVVLVDPLWFNQFQLQYSEYCIRYGIQYTMLNKMLWESVSTSKIIRWESLFHLKFALMKYHDFLWGYNSQYTICTLKLRPVKLHFVIFVKSPIFQWEITDFLPEVVQMVSVVTFC